MDPLKKIKAYQNLSKLGNVTVPYGGKTKYEKFHPGVDVANKKGTPLAPFKEGTVIGVSKGFMPGDNGFGNSVVIQDGQGNKHKYSHLQNTMVKVGQQVKKKDMIGRMGNSGSAYSAGGKGDGTHLDYRVVDAYGKYKDPLTYISKK